MVPPKFSIQLVPHGPHLNNQQNHLPLDLLSGGFPKYPCCYERKATVNFSSSDRKERIFLATKSSTKVHQDINKPSNLFSFQFSLKSFKVAKNC